MNQYRDIRYDTIYRAIASRLFTGEQLTTATGWLVEEAQSSADATVQASSASPPSAKRPKLAPPAHTTAP